MHSRSPWFIQFVYASDFGSHTAEVKVVEWLDVASANDHGRFRNNDGSDQDAVDFVNAYVDKLVPFFPATVTFLSWTVFSQPAPTGAAIPTTGGNFTSKVGTNTVPGWTKAVSITMNLKSVGNFPFKVVMLDGASGNSFDKVLTLSAGKEQDLFDFLVDPTNPFWARDNTPPQRFLSFTVDLNDKLRERYRMA